MLELELVLDFMCCSCGDQTSVTVKCAGNSLGAGKKPVATIKVPCPSCQGINQVIFAPDEGTLLHVLAADKPRYVLPVPSAN